jgi:hypothetical protein
MALGFTWAFHVQGLCQELRSLAVEFDFYDDASRMMVR